MRSFLRILSILLLVCWMGLIFFLSSQPADVSSKSSGQVIEFIAEKFYPDFENLTEEQKAEVIESMQFTVRKTAHICIFAVLGLFAFLAFISYTKIYFTWRVILALAVGVVYAASDEYHQCFVAGRSCELRDFLLDSAGIAVAVLICTLFVKIIAPLRRKTAFAGITKHTLIKQNAELSESLNCTVAYNKLLGNRVEEYKEKIEELESKLLWIQEAPIIETESVQTVIEPQMESVTDEEIEFTEEVEVINDMETEFLGPVEESIETELAEELEVAEEVEITEQVEVEDVFEAELTDETKYASEIIGEVVVEATKLCNKLAEANDDSKKELVNLALGRTEVLKSEILKILNSEISFEEKKELIEKEKNETYDYFNSIIAQTC